MNKKNSMRSEPIITPDTVRQSILELRRIYSEMSDDRFATWYAAKYKISAGSVRQVLSERV